jgi:nucleoside-diphosphate-sugar epimerase
MVHVDDVAEAYVLALQRGRPGETYFLGDQIPLPRRDVINRVAQSLGRPQVGGVPGWLLGLFYGFALVEAVVASMRLRSDKARNELGWQPRYASFTEGLAQVASQLVTTA